MPPTRTALPRPLLPLAANPLPGLVFVDCESSGLATPSYPVEVGLAWCDRRSEALLIRPHESWDAWVWSAEAEEVHGLSRADLMGGADPEEAVAWLEERVAAGGEAVSDSPAWDGYWLDRLYEAAGRRRPFALRPVRAVVETLVAGLADPERAWRSAESMAVTTCAPSHRAADDALYWAEAVRLCWRAGRGRGPR